MEHMGENTSKKEDLTRERAPGEFGTVLDSHDAAILHHLTLLYYWSNAVAICCNSWGFPSQILLGSCSSRIITPQKQGEDEVDPFMARPVFVAIVLNRWILDRWKFSTARLARFVEDREFCIWKTCGSSLPGDFHSHGGTRSHHPFWIGIFPNKNHPYIWVPPCPWLWKMLSQLLPSRPPNGSAAQMVDTLLANASKIMAVRSQNPMGLTRHFNHLNPRNAPDVFFNYLAIDLNPRNVTYTIFFSRRALECRTGWGVMFVVIRAPLFQRGIISPSLKPQNGWFAHDIPIWYRIYKSDMIPI